jgi:hypothetical protein
MTMTEPIIPTDEQLAEFVTTHLAAHPDDDAYAVRDAARAAGWRVQGFEVFYACEKVRPIPTLGTVADALEFMTTLRQRYDDVAVFWDRGWGDSGERAEITVIVGGNGQMPLARLGDGVYRDLVADGLVGADCYGGFKARRVHDFTPSVIA